MAPPKTSHVAKKKRITRGSSSQNPQPDFMESDMVQNFDQHKFSSETAANRFAEIMPRSLIPERKVKLNPGEYDEFRLELERRNWHKVLADLPNEIDEVLVKEFYANAYQQVRDGPRQCRVRGKLIKYDRKIINTFLRTASPPAGHVTPFSEFSSAHKDHDAIASALCTPGHTYMLGVNGNPIRILRKHLTSLAQMWSAFSYTNLSPNTHTSDLNLMRSYLIYGLVTGMDMDVGAHISQDIAYTADMENVKLGFPALITALCREKGIIADTPVLLSLQPPIDKKFIRKNCISRVELNEPAPPPRAPRPPRASSSSQSTHDPSSTFEASFQAAMTKMFARQEDMWLGHQALRQGQVNIIDSMHHLSLGVPDFPDDLIMTGAQFEARIPWPVGRPESQWGGGTIAADDDPDAEEGGQEDPDAEEEEQGGP